MRNEKIFLLVVAKEGGVIIVNLVREAGSWGISVTYLSKLITMFQNIAHKCTKAGEIFQLIKLISTCQSTNYYIPQHKVGL